MSKEIKTTVCGQCNCLHGCAKDELTIDQLTFIKTKMKNTGIELIAKERQEQIEKHGYTDVGYNESGELLHAAAFAIGANTRPPSNWESHFEEKMSNKNIIESLTVAGALIAAEIDRIQRLEGL